MEDHTQDNAPVTKKVLMDTLGEFTEQVLLPAVDQIVQTRISKEIAASEYRMKEWVDEKFANLHADLVLLTRKEDRKVLRLVDMLRQKHVISDAEAADLLHMEPFPQM